MIEVVLDGGEDGATAYLSDNQYKVQSEMTGKMTEFRGMTLKSAVSPDVRRLLSFRSSLICTMFSLRCFDSTFCFLSSQLLYMSACQQVFYMFTNTIVHVLNKYHLFLTYLFCLKVVDKAVLT